MHVIREQPWAKHWSAPAFAAFLRAAAAGNELAAPSRALAPPTSAATNAAKARIRECRAARAPVSLVQARASHAFIAISHKCSPKDLILKRVLRWLPKDAMGGLYLDGAPETLRRLSPHLASCIVKTLLGCWCTTYRLHSEARGCIFGCLACQDSMKHYVKCRRLLGPLSLVLGPPRLPGTAYEFGLSTSSLHRAAFLFMTFHAVSNHWNGTPPSNDKVIAITLAALRSLRRKRLTCFAELRT